MGITHSINPPDGKLSRKFSRQVRKDGLPQTQISEEAANANSHDNYSTKVSLPPSPISSDPIVTSIDKTIYDNSTKRVSKYILPNNEQELDRLVQIVSVLNENFICMCIRVFVITFFMEFLFHSILYINICLVLIFQLQ